MNRKKTLKKPGFTLSDMPVVKIKTRDDVTRHSSTDYFKNHQKVATALLQCLIEDDTEAFMEILDAYLNVNRTKVAESKELARSTIQHAFAKGSNPTLKTIAKIVHNSVKNQQISDAKSMKR